MATRQYIGARYVPKFADPIDWNSDTSYEPLTIVNYLGGSYTSKKAVPAGVVPTNTDYWVATGNYNAQVEEYRQEVEACVDKVSTFTGERVILIGDSYAIRPNTTEGWGKKVVDYLGIASGNHYDIFVEQSGFCRSASFLGNLTAESANIPDHDTIGRIIVIGGYNDFTYSKSEIVTAIGTFMTYCKSEYPNAKVVVGCCACDKGTQSYASNILLRSIEGYRECVVYGAEYINLEGVLHNTAFLGEDNIHPTATGGTALAKAIANALQGGNSYSEYNFRQMSTAEGFTGNGFKFTEYFNNGMLFISGWDGPAITCSISIASGNLTINAWECENRRLFGDVGATGIPMQVVIQYTKNTNTYNVVKEVMLVQTFGSDTFGINVNFTADEIGGTITQITVNKNWFYACQQMAK